MTCARDTLPIETSSTNAIRDFFEVCYSRPTRYWWKPEWRYSTNPRDHIRSPLAMLLLDTMKSMRSGRILDIGAGEGSDAIRLGSLSGWSVDAVELSTKGCQKIEDYARALPTSVNVIEADFTRLALNTSYEIIIAHGVLHYMVDPYAVIERIASLLRPGGLCSISVFTDYTPLCADHLEVPTFPVPAKSWLDVALASWPGVRWLENDKPELSHPGFPIHRHSHAKMLVKRPLAFQSMVC